jgi:hypothetical protein
MADPLRLTIHHAASSAIIGLLTQLTSQGAVTLAEPQRYLPAGELVSITRVNRPRPDYPQGPQVILAHGDRLAAEVLGGDDLAIRVRTAFSSATPNAEWRIPLAQIQVLWLIPPPIDTPYQIDRYDWLEQGRKKDVVLFRNGDFFAGEIERFSDDGPSLIWKPAGVLNSTRVDLNRVAAIAFNPTLVVGRLPKGTFTRIVTTHGDRLSAVTVEADQDRLRGTTAFRATFDLPIHELIALDVMQGPAVYLSDLKPIKDTTEGYSDLAWPWAADQTVKRNPLRLVTSLGEETFDKGLGTHPKTTLVYDLGGRYRRFEAIVGLDAMTGRRGTAKVHVLVDGQNQAIPGLEELTAVNGSVEINVDVTSAKELILQVDYGSGGDVQADVNWANARLVK